MIKKLTPVTLRTFLQYDINVDDTKLKDYSDNAPNTLQTDVNLFKTKSLVIL